ncbi:EEF1A lysine methyltransferase 2 isoform X2 [Petromyzon marinus]|uniref:EEF1A lysine methyltransferase 2 isoform X2 n=1 Tax=Petromyzon marinus TaxID=7757 RepID=UPI003F716D21
MSAVCADGAHLSSGEELMDVEMDKVPGCEDEQDDEDFEPSQLGTKSYWEDAYQRELSLYRDTGDVGEVWFGWDSMKRVVRWIEARGTDKDSSVLDIGTGNGVLLLELAKVGFTRLTGIDYSAAAVRLAQSIASEQGHPHIVFQEVDFLALAAAAGDRSLGPFDVCVDKGTLDAVSLSPDGATERRADYVEALRRMLGPGGLFVITSCNWTRPELLSHFSDGFELEEQIPTPTFTFGGSTGNSITSLVFRRRG